MLFSPLMELSGWILVPLALGMMWALALYIEPYSPSACRILMATVGISAGFVIGAFVGMALGTLLGMATATDGFDVMGFWLWAGLAGGVSGGLYGYRLARDVF